MPLATRIPLALWEREKEHIRVLYLDKDKTLDELVQCMADEHGFYATRAQYIRRLDNWKMKKYSTKQQWEYVDALVRKRKSEGKESEVVMGGKTVSIKKLKKELGRYARPTSFAPEDAYGGVVARTPPPIAVLFDTRFITCATVPWFLFHVSFVSKVTSAVEHTGQDNDWQFALTNQVSNLGETILGKRFSESTAATAVEAALPKRPSAGALETRSPGPELFVQILCWAVYQSSNCLLSDNQTDNFLQWIIDHGSTLFLHQLARMNDSVTRILMANLLLSAIRLDSKETVRFLLNAGTNPGVIRRISRETALQLAVKDMMANAEIVRLLLEHGACPNTTCPESAEERSPLCLAMMGLPWKRPIAEMLILAGADVNTPYPDTKHSWILKTPLIAAAAQKDVSLIDLLLKKGADPNIFVPSSGSALHVAVQTNCVGSVEALLEAGANANIPYGEGNDTKLSHMLKHLAQSSPDDVLDSLLTPIDVAYANKNSKIANLLLQANAHVDGCLAFVADWDRGTGHMALQNAARRGEFDLVFSFLMKGVAVNAPSVDVAGRTALQAAAEAGDIGLVRLLLDRGASLSAPPCYSGGLTALQAAIYSGNRDLVELLIWRGGDINAAAARYGGQTCLEAAVSIGDVDLVDMLLNFGADINATSPFPDCREISALTWSIARLNHGLFDLLLSKGAKPDVPQDCPTPLCAAIAMKSFEMARRLIEAGADVNRPSRGDDAISSSSHLQTPLQTAIELGDIQLINLLIDSHADIDYSRDGMRPGSALQTAIFCRNRDVVQLLLALEVDPGNTMSHAAAILDTRSPVDLEILQMLLSHKAEVNPQSWDVPPHQSAVDLQGSTMGVEPAMEAAMDIHKLRLTPLQAALERGKEELANMLLEAGADVNAPASSRGGKTALQAAAMKGNLSFVKHLVLRGADVNAPPAREHGATALQFAAMKGHYNVVVFLLENEADVNAPPAPVGGRTALEGAAEHGRLDIVHLLLENDQEEETLGQRCQDAAVSAERYGHFVIAEILHGWKKVR